MKHTVIHLKELFPELGESSGDPTLTTYLPYNLAEMNWQDKKRPNILLCPGGAYRYCSEREDEPIALNFLSEGYNVFVLHYTGSRAFPTQLREAAAAMELICRNADDWNVDTGRIAIMGFSAGGHLAAHYSNAYDCPQVREIFPDSKPVQASVLCYPVISADPRYRHTGSIQNLSGHQEITQQDIALFSCEKLVTDKTPPAFLWHTTTDAVVPVINSLLYAQALAEHKIPFALHVYPHGCHGLSTVDERSNGAERLTAPVVLAHDWLDAAKKWLAVTL